MQDDENGSFWDAASNPSSFVVSEGGWDLGACKGKRRATVGFTDEAGAAADPPLPAGGVGSGSGSAASSPSQNKGKGRVAAPPDAEPPAPWPLSRERLAGPSAPPSGSPSALGSPRAAASLRSGADPSDGGAGLPQSPARARLGSVGSFSSFSDQRAAFQPGGRPAAHDHAPRQRARSVGNLPTEHFNSRGSSPGPPSYASLPASRPRSPLGQRRRGFFRRSLSNAALDSMIRGQGPRVETSEHLATSGKARWMAKLGRVLPRPAAPSDQTPPSEIYREGLSAHGAGDYETQLSLRLQGPSSPLANLVPVNAPRGAPTLPTHPAERSPSRSRPIRSMSVPLLPTLSPRSMPGVGLLRGHNVPVDLFDLMLPRELRLQVFRALANAGADEEDADGPWVGEARGWRELVKCSRVSKTWLSLAYDGQLWPAVNVGLLLNGGDEGCGISARGLVKLMQGAGPFVRELKLRGLGADLTSAGLLQVTDEAARVTAGRGSETCIRSLDLSGCRALSTQALHYLLIRCPHVSNLALRGMTAVTDGTCDLLGQLQPPLASLDLRCCPNMGAPALLRGCPVLGGTMKELRLGRCRWFDDQAMVDIGRALPGLEILDVNGNEGLTDAGMRGFAAVSHVAKTTLITLHQDDKRRMPLRHLNVASCTALTDSGFDALAHAVPELRFLEAAGLGTEVKDKGLVALFATTPFIRKVDLEDASEITDRVVNALTPAPTRHRTHRSRLPSPEETQTGQHLEHLVLSYCTHISDGALVSCIRLCPKLRVLEVDNTRVSDQVVKQFVKSMRHRGTRGSEFGAVDARGVSKAVICELEPSTRPRRGRSEWFARSLNYMQQNVGTSASASRLVDEMDASRVIVHSFWNWSRLDDTQRQRAQSRAHRFSGPGDLGTPESRIAGGFLSALGLGDYPQRPHHRRGSSANCHVM